jgi:hypothetical protein
LTLRRGRDWPANELFPVELDNRGMDRRRRGCVPQRGHSGSASHRAPRASPSAQAISAAFIRRDGPVGRGWVLDNGKVLCWSLKRDDPRGSGEAFHGQPQA